MSKVTKNIWYKRAQIQGVQDTLEDLLIAAVAKCSFAADRLMPVDSGERLGINGFQTGNAMFFGQFLTFTPGMRQPLLTLANGSTAYNLETIAAAKAKDGSQQEFIESIAYFGVIEDHVLLVQTRAITSRDLEDYLRWLLCTATSCVPSGTMIVLDDPAASVAAKKAARKNIRGVTIGSQVTANVSPDATRKGDAVTRYELDSGISQVLKGIFGNGIFQNLQLKDSLEQDNIEVQLTVRVKGKQTVSADGQKLLRAIGRATRHMDPRDYELELSRSGSLKGSELKLHHPVSVDQSDSGLIDETDLMAKMKLWLAEIMQKNFVDT